MGAHSDVVGGSGAERYINCLGSTALKKLAPKQGSSEYADEGTMLHFVIETVLNADPDHEDADPNNFIGEEIVLDEPDDNGEEIAIEVTEQHVVDKLEPALKWFDEVLQPDDYWCEIKVSYDGDLEGAFGTADILFVRYDEEGVVESAGKVDWKFGDGVMVDAEDNYQSKFYLRGALKLPWFAKLTEHLDEFEAHICQPVVDREQIANDTTFTRAELEDFEAELLNAKRAKDEGARDLNIGKWCKFCPAEVICPAWRDRGKAALENVPRETLKPPTKKQKEDPEFEHISYDHDALREAFLIAHAMSGWCDAVKKLVKTEFDEGRPVDGLKKVVYQNERQWIDEGKVKGWLRREGLKAADMNEPARLKSVAAIEKIVGKGNVRDDMIRSAPKGFSYVPSDDPRPAYDDGRDPNSTSATLGAALGKK